MDIQDAYDNEQLDFLAITTLVVTEVLLGSLQYFRTNHGNLI